MLALIKYDPDHNLPISEARQKIEKLKMDMHQLQETLKNLQSINIKDIQSKIDQVATDAANTNTRIDSFEETVIGRFDRLEAFLYARLPPRPTKSRLEEFRNFLSSSTPSIVLLCETFWNNKFSVKFRTYNLINKNRTDRPGGGVAILVHHSIHYTPLIIRTSPNIEEVGISINVTGYGKIDIISVYCPHSDCTKEEITQLLGSSNTKKPLVGGDLKGTYVNPSTGRTSTLDLTIMLAVLACDATVTLGPYLGSDHLPVIIDTKMLPAHPDVNPPKWIFEEGHDTNQNALQLYNHLQNALLEASHNLFKLTKPNSRTTPEPIKPWWNADCEASVKAARQKKLWAFTKAMTGKNRSPFTASHDLLSQSGETITDPKAKAEFFLKTFFDCPYYHGIAYRHHEEQIKEAMSSTNPSPPNKPITTKEIESGLIRLKSNATGLDLIHNKILANLNYENREYMRLTFNALLLHGVSPPEWKQAVVIPILKPNKQLQDPVSYHPISLTSCLGKVMERIIKNRLSCQLASGDQLSTSTLSSRLPTRQKHYRPYSGPRKCSKNSL
ncbi:Uncharacterized protein APZ42_031838 [Daphnia magna]|uniref:Endonuclease/exonuclease/phosphatase domain-containing protein n=1 Tax=Daphnia magna TaxID=35525 RepID=A0A164MHP7_9CRUS|nr:Uncharacterized protein APZ42_031838 [Daphnia magna]